MGDFNVKMGNSEKEIREFTRHLLRDVQAMEKMLEEGKFETGTYKIGAEQEFCLVDKNFKPYPINLKILEEAQMENLSPELAKFNLETNASPQKFEGKAISLMEEEIIKDLAKIRKIVNKHQGDIILTGILPTIRKFDVGRDNITPIQRYYALMDSLRKMRGEEFLINIYGLDELNIKLDSGMIEAANTGFQVHLQVDPDDFVKKYNIAQAIAGPALAVSVNAPLLFGKRLWRETRIALFQQAIDTRVSTEHIREHHPRVTFGTDWVKNSVLDLFREDILRYRVLLGADFEEDSLEMVRQGETPILKALTVHNSTVYRWNRPVYGIANGKPHLRIEARMFPAGPTVVDEMANTALWLGLMEGYSNQIDDVRKYMFFDEAKDNFFAAARSGIAKNFIWFNHKRYPLKELVLKELLPIAKEGLQNKNINPGDIDKYLGIIEERIQKESTGSNWMLNTFKEFQEKASKEEILSLITEKTIENQIQEIPVHQWKIPEFNDLPHWKPSDLLVEEVMQTDILSVQPDDIVEFVADMMDWAKIRYVPVENDKGDFVGLITSRNVLRTLRKIADDESLKDFKVKDIMIKTPETIEPYKKVEEAMDVMDKKSIGSLPVIQKNKLIGMLTEADFFRLSKRLFNRFK